MKSKYIFITYLEHYGGIETLVFRMIDWLNKNDYDVDLIVDDDRNEDESMLDIARKSCKNIYSLPFRRSVSEKQLKSVDMNGFDSIKIICFTYPEFFLAHQIKRSFKEKNIDIIFYVPHQYGLILEFNFNNGIAKKIGSWLGKHFIKRADENNEIIHMDYLCLERLETEYGIKSNPNNVVPLATEIYPIDSKRIDRIFDKESVTILSVARAMFPFKGYLFGLMDLFDSLCEKNNRLELKIIGDGPDFQRLKEHKEKKTHRDRIQLLGQVAYDELPKYFNDAKVYVGMGTTVLDAANHSVLSFPIGSYTYECKGYDYYYKDGMNLGGLYGEKDITNLINDALNMDKSTYMDIVGKQYDEIFRCYEINSIMQKIDSFKNANRDNGVSCLDLMFIKFIKQLYTIKSEVKK